MADVVPGAINIGAASLTNDHIITIATPVAAQTTLGNMSTFFNAGSGGPYVPTAGGVTITGALTLSAAGTALTITNNATVTGVLTVNGAAAGLVVKNSATVGGDITVTGKFGVNGKAAVAAQTVAGAKLASDVVMASLLTALVAEGLVIDTTT